MIYFLLLIGYGPLLVGQATFAARVPKMIEQTGGKIFVGQISLAHCFKSYPNCFLKYFKVLFSDKKKTWVIFVFFWAFNSTFSHFTIFSSTL
jgi:hypothetical protein